MSGKINGIFGSNQQNRSFLIFGSNPGFNFKQFISNNKFFDFPIQINTTVSLSI